MRKLQVAVFALFLAGITLPVDAAQFIDTNTIMRQSALTNNLNLQFQNPDGTVYGALLYPATNSSSNRFFGFLNVNASYLGFFTHNTTRFLVGGVEQMRVQAGSVRIGTDPAETAVKLTINGAIDVKAGIAAQYQDVAEWVPALGDPTPGTVVILDANVNNTVVASETPYDTRVAGVVSPQPGLILGIPGDDKVMVATTGRVNVKVDASAAPIKIGDLLVTSDKPGVAMKSIPVEVAGIQMHRPGTVVGKALEPLASGTGEILVLLSMQ